MQSTRTLAASRPGSEPSSKGPTELAKLATAKLGRAVKASFVSVIKSNLQKKSKRGRMKSATLVPSGFASGSISQAIGQRKAAAEVGGKEEAKRILDTIG